MCIRHRRRLAVSLAVSFAVLLLAVLAFSAGAGETVGDVQDQCSSTRQRLDILARTVTLAELENMPRMVGIVRDRFQRMKMSPERRAELLAGLDEVESSLALGRPEPFGQATLHFHAILAGGNSLPPWDVECLVGYAECVDSGFPPELCAVGLLLCLAYCEPADVLAVPATCADPVNITLGVPVALQYAEVPPQRDCPPPGIGDASEALREAGRAICATGNCKQGRCVPEQSTTLTVDRQLNQFSRVEDGTRQCFVVVRAEYKSDCVCK